jgi:hypothetical protein
MILCYYDEGLLEIQDSRTLRRRVAPGCWQAHCHISLAFEEISLLMRQTEFMDRRQQPQPLEFRRLHFRF